MQSIDSSVPIELPPVEQMSAAQALRHLCAPACLAKAEAAGDNESERYQWQIIHGTIEAFAYLLEAKGNDFTAIDVRGLQCLLHGHSGQTTETAHSVLYKSIPLLPNTEYDAIRSCLLWSTLIQRAHAKLSSLPVVSMDEASGQLIMQRGNGLPQVITHELAVRLKDERDGWTKMIEILQTDLHCALEVCCGVKASAESKPEPTASEQVQFGADVFGEAAVTPVYQKDEHGGPIPGATTN